MSVEGGGLRAEGGGFITCSHAQTPHRIDQRYASKLDRIKKWIRAAVAKPRSEVGISELDGSFDSGFGFRVSGFGFRVSGFVLGFRVSDFVFCVSDIGSYVSGFEKIELQVSDFGLEFLFSGFVVRVLGFRFRISGFGFQISGLGFRV